MTNSDSPEALISRKLINRIGLILGALVFLALIGRTTTTEPAPATPTLVAHTDAGNGQRIIEDDPRWNCMTMGNHQCGTRTVQEDDPQWDCRTMGNLVCGEGATVNGQAVEAGDYSPVTNACWLEDKADGTTEQLYGDTSLMPAGSTPVECEQATQSVVTVHPSDVSDDLWDELTEAGYTGDPTDGQEALYVPASVLQAACDY